MFRLRSFITFSAILGSSVCAAESNGLITYNTLPLGTPESPLLLRTYFPEIDLDPAVLGHHHHAGPSPRYDPEKGVDVAGEYQPIKGIPAAIGVNHGPSLSYIFDTTEGRMLYAWQGGFVDMFPYWGDRVLGNRVGNAYVPQLVGTVFYKASGSHPVQYNGKGLNELGEPKFIGYDLVNKQPTFLARFGAVTVKTKIQPLPNQLGLKLEISTEPAGKLTYRSEDSRFTVRQDKTRDGTMSVELIGTELASYSGYPRKINITEASAAAGEQLAQTYGCVVCHSNDGSPGHGPTWTGLFGKSRPLVDGSMVKADEAYLLESIKTPNAKIAQSFTPNFMPAYTMLKPVEIQSLVLYIESLGQPQ